MKANRTESGTEERAKHIKEGAKAMEEHKNQIQLVIQKLEAERDKLDKELQHLKAVTEVINNYKLFTYEVQE